MNYKKGNFTKWNVEILIHSELIESESLLTMGLSQDDLLIEPTNKYHLLLALLYDLVNLMEMCGSRIKSSVISAFSTCHFKISLLRLVVSLHRCLSRILISAGRLFTKI